jgi:hypothetical protein
MCCIYGDTILKYKKMATIGGRNMLEDTLYILQYIYIYVKALVVLISDNYSVCQIKNSEMGRAYGNLGGGGGDESCVQDYGGGGGRKKGKMEDLGVNRKTILCFVDRASLHNLVNKANLVHNFTPPCIPDSDPYRVTSTKCHIDTVVSPDDGHIVARKM